MTVSVVIPAFNNAAYVGQAVDSVLAQDYKDLEIIIVDDGSTDHTSDVISNYGNSVNYIYQDNGGAPVARNTGISAAKSEYIAFLDSDDIWEPTNLATKMKVLREHADLDAVFSDFSIFNDDGTAVAAAMRTLYPIFSQKKRRLQDIFDEKPVNLCAGDQHTPLYEGNIFHSLLHGNFINLCSIVARKEALLTAGAFNESLITQQDYDLWLRLSRRSRIGFIDAPLVRYRRHATQLTARKHTTRILRTVTGVLQPYYDERRKILNEDEAVRFSHRYADVFVQLGLAHLGNRKPREARAAFKEAMRVAPLRLRRAFLWIFSQLPPVVTHDLIMLAKRQANEAKPHD